MRIWHEQADGNWLVQNQGHPARFRCNEEQPKASLGDQIFYVDGRVGLVTLDGIAITETPNTQGFGRSSLLCRAS